MSYQEQFTEASKHWHLEALYQDLAAAKGKRLTPVEKLHLRGLLCGYSPAEIAQKLNKSVKGVEVDLCQTLYQYIKNILGKCTEKIENWRKITEWLTEAGYKIESSQFEQESNGYPKLMIRNATIKIESNQVVVDFNLRIVAPLVTELLPLENLDFIPQQGVKNYNVNSHE